MSIGSVGIGSQAVIMGIRNYFDIGGLGDGDYSGRGEGGDLSNARRHKGEAL